MPVSAIFENLEAGANIDDIMEWVDGPDAGDPCPSPSVPERGHGADCRTGRMEPIVAAVNAAAPGTYSCSTNR
jgi:hypothetical protein